MKKHGMLIVAAAHYVATALASRYLLPLLEAHPSKSSGSAFIGLLEPGERAGTNWWYLADQALGFPINLLECGGSGYLPGIVNSLLWGLAVVWGIRTAACCRRKARGVTVFDEEAGAAIPRQHLLVHLLLIAAFCFGLQFRASWVALLFFALLFGCTRLDDWVATRIGHWAHWSLQQRTRVFHMLGAGWVAGIVLLTLVPYPSALPKNTESPRNTFPHAVAQARELSSQARIPRHLMMRGAVRWRTDFDVNRLFAAFDRLEPEPGYVLDYVYPYRALGGMPVVYARRTHAVPYLTYAAWADAWTNEGPLYLDHVRTDGTPEGYAQLVALNIMAEQFYVFWHAIYSTVDVVAERPHLDKVLALSQSFRQITDEEIRSIQTLDLNPRVELLEDTVRVSLLVWTEWGGLFRETYTITRAFPHRIQNRHKENILQYFSNLTY